MVTGSPDDGWNERDNRYAADVSGFVTLKDGQRVRVLICNVSPAGCQLASDHNFQIGEVVILELPVPLHGQVRWCVGGRAGVSFLVAERDSVDSHQ